MDELTQQKGTDMPLVATETKAPEPTPVVEPEQAPTVTPEPTITQATPPVTPAAIAPQVATTSEPAVTPAVAVPAKNAFVQILMENKKVVVIGVTAVVAVVIGLSVLIGAKSSDEYQGLIKRIDSQTQELNNASQTNISSPSISSPSATDSSVDSSSSTIDNSIPFEMEGTPAAKVAR